MTRNTSTPNRPRGRRSKDMPDGRQALLVAATRAFADLGFDGADLRTIATAADVSPNLVRVHFGSKAALWEACLNGIAAAAIPTMAEVRRIADDASRPLGERLRDAIDTVAAFYIAHPDVRNFVIRHGAETAERADLLTERLLRPAYETTRQLFASGIDAGIIRSSHPALFFALLNSALNQPPAFATLLKRLAPDVEDQTTKDRLVDTIVSTFLNLPPAGTCGKSSRDRKRS
jgi:AcrR family transcriptional regulator